MNEKPFVILTEEEARQQGFTLDEIINAKVNNGLLKENGYMQWYLSIPLLSS